MISLIAPQTSIQASMLGFLYAGPTLAQLFWFIWGLKTDFQTFVLRVGSLIVSTITCTFNLGDN